MKKLISLVVLAMFVSVSVQAMPIEIRLKNLKEIRQEVIAKRQEAKDAVAAARDVLLQIEGAIQLAESIIQYEADEKAKRADEEIKAAIQAGEEAAREELEKEKAAAVVLEAITGEAGENEAILKFTEDTSGPMYESKVISPITDSI